MKKYIWISAGAALFSATSAHALTVTTSTDADSLAAATLASSSGISIVAGSASYVGEDAQGGTYSDFTLSNGSNTVALGDGVVLTSGLATGIVVSDNTDASFDGSLGTAGDADMSAVLTAAGASSSVTNDANTLSFNFTVDPGKTSVSASFVFGSDEYPTESVTDIFAVFVDGVNYAEFSDGSLINFTLGSVSAGFFLDNRVDSATPYTHCSGEDSCEFQYDGFTSVLTVTGLLSADYFKVNEYHTIKIAIADTSDTIFDSGVFFSGLTAGTDTGGGITDPNAPNPIPLPAGAWLMLAGLGAFGAIKRRKKVS